ncbi:Hypothetical_protein [Hexamita inflata]|uniref:Hypothetical_protein n=1 Tax=Hexamita inflata TaxID=28002 RepID=A0AA86QZ35_9EUKA|nr:Hypothetical protein HINF_LOCUS49974 [Hexamita inflata]
MLVSPTYLVPAAFFIQIRQCRFLKIIAGYKKLLRRVRGTFCIFSFLNGISQRIYISWRTQCPFKLNSAYNHLLQHRDTFLNNIMTINALEARQNYITRIIAWISWQMVRSTAETKRESENLWLQQLVAVIVNNILSLIIYSSLVIVLICIVIVLNH